MSKPKDVIVMKNGKVVNDQKEAQETKPQEAKTPAKDSQAVAKQIQELNLRLAKVEEGWRQFMDQVSYSKGFYDGRLYIVSQAERILCEQTGCKTREELMSTGKLPSFWIATLVVCLDDPPNVLNLVVKEKHERQ